MLLNVKDGGHDKILVSKEKEYSDTYEKYKHELKRVNVDLKKKEDQV